MRIVNGFLISSNHWPLVGSVGLNTNILEINIINLGVVLAVLFYFGKGVCAGCIFD